MYHPIGKCIYCGATDVQLSREHIIPYSLGGNLVLPKASCPDHAKLTSLLEMEVARNTYGIYRAAQGIRSRRRNKQESSLENKIRVNGVDFNGNQVHADLRVADLPCIPLLVRLEEPGYFTDDLRNLKSGIRLECVESSQLIFQELLAKLHWHQLTVSSSGIRPDSFIRVLAKIAHAYSCAEYAGRFKPLLLPLILGEVRASTHLVGGFSPQLAQAALPLIAREITHTGERLLIVEISLHFFPKLPRYQVISGKII